MSWLNFFDTKTISPKHSFGRGVGASISPDEEELFYKSYQSFEDKNIVDAYDYFFQSLQNFKEDKANNNIILKRDNDKLEFEVYQGCAKVVGVITQEHFNAEVIITKSENASVALKRYILERNYQLTYACYYSDDNYIKLKVFYDNITMTPQKIYFPIRELALNADFDKEHIFSEFEGVVLEDSGHIKPLNQEELKLKFDFFKSWVDELEAKILTLPTNDNAGMQSFIHLNIFFKIDYLLVPQFKLNQKILKEIRDYYNLENQTIEAKNSELNRCLHEIDEMGFEEFSLNFYDAKYTFNPIDKSSFEEVSAFISESLLKVKWYKNNRYQQIVSTIYSYMSFYIVYNYGLNQVLKELLHLLIEVQNQTFFEALGYEKLYKDEVFSKKNIIKRVVDIVEPHRVKYQQLQPFGKDLNFSTLNEFSHSFFLQINNLSFEEL